MSPLLSAIPYDVSKGQHFILSLLLIFFPGLSFNGQLYLKCLSRNKTLMCPRQFNSAQRGVGLISSTQVPTRFVPRMLWAKNAQMWHLPPNTTSLPPMSTWYYSSRFLSLKLQPPTSAVLLPKLLCLLLQQDALALSRLWVQAHWPVFEV